MAIIAPFKGLTYNFHKKQNFSSLVAPPYDVISREEQDSYYRADAHNVIRLILSKQKTGDSDWDNKYTRTANFFNIWKSDDILIRANQPSVYVTSLTYDPGDGEAQRTRWGIITLVRIEDIDSGVILPHERTFSAHKDDRLKLIRACNAQFSQVFSLFKDPDNRVFDACKKDINSSPQVSFYSQDGMKHEMWVLQRPSLLKNLADAMLEKRFFIADGHHRYETSRNFRNIMRARFGLRPANRSYEYVMMYLSNMSDEGLTILPSHRLIKSVPNFRLETFIKKLEPYFQIKEVPFHGTNMSAECAIIKQNLEQTGINNTVMGFYQHKAGKYYLFLLKPGAREALGDDLHPALKTLDVVVLSRLILQKGLGFSKEDLDNDKIFHYQSNMKATISDVKSENSQMVFLLNPTKMDQVIKIADNSLVMPRKSTYFYPKVLTGMVFNEIDPYEIIQVP